MSIDDLLAIFRRSRRRWRLFHSDDTMECRITELPTGVEIRFEYCGELYHSFVHATRADAEREADEKRRELIQAGWSEHAAGEAGQAAP